METLDELIDNFDLFDSWEDRYRYLIDLGNRLPEMDESLLVDENLVKGCTSKVWLVIGRKDGRFHFTATSDAQIVRGLIYFLITAYEGRTAAEILSYDIEGRFEKLGLDQYLSPNRRNGFFAMVEKIKAAAQDEGGV